jgi:hypothetical protein
MNNYNKIEQNSLFYHSLLQLKAMNKGGKIILNHGGFNRTFTVVEEKANRMVLKNEMGKIYNIVQRDQSYRRKY